MKNFFKRMVMRESKPKFLFTTQHLGMGTGNGTRIARESGNSQTLTQFVSVESIASGTWGVNTASGGMIAPLSDSQVQAVMKSPENPADERKAVKPIEVFAELKKADPGTISFDDLDEKIKVVKDRIEVLSEHLDPSHLKDEQKALFFLENRRTYLDTRKKNPIDWAITTYEAVEDLCKRYKLQVVPLKQYYTLVPSDGLKEMTRYTKAYKAVTGDEPIFELVIKDTYALPAKEAKETKKKDRDPILLANSPFSNAMFVLGAWDDEVEVVDEIIYQGK